MTGWHQQMADPCWQQIGCPPHMLGHGLLSYLDQERAPCAEAGCMTTLTLMALMASGLPPLLEVNSLASKPE